MSNAILDAPTPAATPCLPAVQTDADIESTARRYVAAGLSVLPIASDGSKGPTVPWKAFQDERPTENELTLLFRRNVGIGVIGGRVSGGLEIFDFDEPGLFEQFAADVSALIPGLVDRLTIIATPKGGRHAAYRCDRVAGNQKLALGENREVRIETRGEGGYVIAPPSPGCCHPTGREYVHLSGPSYAEGVNRITADERETLLRVARSFDLSPQSEAAAYSGPQASDSAPGNDFNRRAIWDEILTPAGWTRGYSRQGITHWRRPGKRDGISATTGLRSQFGNELFHVFSSNAWPFELNGNYSKFAAYTLLHHAGDFSAAAGELASRGYGQPRIEAIDDSEFEAAELGPADPGPFPESLLDVPGFIAEVMAFNLAAAHKPQPVLALAGAISLLAVLTGRKIKDASGTRTNLYVLGVADSGAGKERARKVNTDILFGAGFSEALGEGIASSAGLITAIELSPAKLFQLDEIGRYLRTLGDARQKHLYEIISVLMRLYTRADSSYVSDAYAETKKTRTIYQPHVCLYGTTVPESLYDSLTEENLTDGFYARTMIFEGKPDPGRQAVRDIEVPQSLIEQARWWGQYQPPNSSLVPRPLSIETEPAADKLLVSFENQCEENYRELGKPFGVTWLRTGEKARKLALLYAASGSQVSGRIGNEAAEWGIGVSAYLTKRMIFLASRWVSSSAYEAKIKKIMRMIESARETGLTRTKINNGSHLPARERQELLADIVERRLAKEIRRDTGGRPEVRYVAAKFVRATS